MLPSEFYILTALTGWATCNSKDVPSKEDIPSEPQNKDDFEASTSQEEHPELSLPKETIIEKKLMEK